MIGGRAGRADFWDCQAGGSGKFSSLWAGRAQFWGGEAGGFSHGRGGQFLLEMDVWSETGEVLGLAGGAGSASGTGEILGLTGGRTVRDFQICGQGGGDSGIRRRAC